MINDLLPFISREFSLSLQVLANFNRLITNETIISGGLHYLSFVLKQPDKHT